MKFKVLLFELHSVPAVFHRLVDLVVNPTLEKNDFSYLYDIVMVSATFKEHIHFSGINAS
jgi:hypothetical protein